MATSAIQQNSPGFFYNLFAPLPPEETILTAPPKDGFDHLAGYAVTTSGSWDLFRVFDHIMQYFQKLPNLSDSAKDLASRVSKVTNLGGIALSVPTIASDLNTVRKKTKEFAAALDLNDNAPLRQQKVLQGGKGVFLSTMWLTNTIAQAILFLNESGLVKLAEYAPVADGVYQGSSFISDGIDLIEQGYQLAAYQKAQPSNERETAALEEKKCLTWMRIVKDVSSVALAVIALVGLAFGIAIFSIPFVATIGLGLSTVWLTMKISSYFYDEIIKERDRQATPVLALA